jgi:PEP-CTERM motif
MRIKCLPLAFALALSSTAALAAPATMTIQSEGVLRDAWGSQAAGAPVKLNWVTHYDTETGLDWITEANYDFDITVGTYRGSAVGYGDAYAIAGSADGGTRELAVGMTLREVGIQTEFRLYADWQPTGDVPYVLWKKPLDLLIESPVYASSSYGTRYSGDGDFFYFTPAWVHVSVAVVPEPQTWTMLLGGLAVAGAVARRRKAAV